MINLKKSNSNLALEVALELINSTLFKRPTQVEDVRLVNDYLNSLNEILPNSVLRELEELVYNIANIEY